MPSFIMLLRIGRSVLVTSLNVKENFSKTTSAGWLLVVLRIHVDLAIFQPYLDLEAGDNQSLKIQVARPGIEPRSSCSASQELNHSATAAPNNICWIKDFQNSF